MWRSSGRLAQRPARGAGGAEGPRDGCFAEVPVAPPDRRGAPRADRDRPRPQRAGRPGGAGHGPAGGGRRRQLCRRRPRRRPPRRRRGGQAGGSLRRRGVGRPRCPPRRRPAGPVRVRRSRAHPAGGAPPARSRGHPGAQAGGPPPRRGVAAPRAPPGRRPAGPVRVRRSRAHPAGGAPPARSRDGRDGHLVADDAATGAAVGPRRPADGQHLHDLAGAARRRLDLAAGPHLVPDRGGPSQAESRCGRGHRSGHRRQKGVIERAYATAEALGIPVWCQDEAGPYQAVPQPGPSWQPEGLPAHRPHEYVRGGTAKLLTLFRPATGTVRAQPVARAPNAVLHPWLLQELDAILAALPPPPPDDPARAAAAWEWREAPLWDHAALPPIRVLLVWDNLKGHQTPDLLNALVERGVWPLFTPLGGSW